MEDKTIANWEFGEEDNEFRMKNKRKNRLPKVKLGDILFEREEPLGDSRTQSVYC